MNAGRFSFVVRFAVVVSITVLALVSLPALHAATPPSGTLGGASTKLTYTGTTATVNPAIFDPSTCQTAGSCDVFTLTVNVSHAFRAAHPNFRVNIQFGWSGNTNEFDMYDYFNGKVIATSANSFVTGQLTRLEHPANGVYTIYASFSLGVPGTPYTGTITLQPTPPPITKLAASYTPDPDGKFGPQMFQFTSDVQLVATPATGSAGQDVEPGIVIDPFGNIYVSAIEGVPAGSDLWRSTDFGNTFTYLGQPDQVAGVGTARDYLITVQLGALLNGTDTLIVTQSDDGGITYPNGATVNQALLAGTPETGFHSNIVAFPGNLSGGTPNSAVYTTFTSADGVDLYVASCAAPCNLPVLPQGGPPSKLSFTSTLAFTAPPGATLGNVFTPIAVDNHGNLYVAL